MPICYPSPFSLHRPVGCVFKRTQPLFARIPTRINLQTLHQNQHHEKRRCPVPICHLSPFSPRPHSFNRELSPPAKIVGWVLNPPLTPRIGECPDPSDSTHLYPASVTTRIAPTNTHIPCLPITHAPFALQTKKPLSLLTGLRLSYLILSPYASPATPGRPGPAALSYTVQGCWLRHDTRNWRSRSTGRSRTGRTT